MRVIDLFIKIANGEEVPKKIKYKAKEYYREYAPDEQIYYYIDEYDKNLISEINYSCDLNNEVEIIQDIDIQGIEDIKYIFIENSSCGEDVKYLARKYNELVQAVKQLDNKIKE